MWQFFNHLSAFLCHFALAKLATSSLRVRKTTLHVYIPFQAINAIDSIQWLDQETNTSGALWYMRELFKRSNNVQKIGVIITDGASNRDADRTIPEATLTKASGVELFAIGKE